jgi:hypothetical protein
MSFQGKFEQMSARIRALTAAGAFSIISGCTPFPIKHEPRADEIRCADNIKTTVSIDGVLGRVAGFVIGGPALAEAGGQTLDNLASRREFRRCLGQGPGNEPPKYPDKRDVAVTVPGF